MNGEQTKKDLLRMQIFEWKARTVMFCYNTPSGMWTPVAVERIEFEEVKEKADFITKSNEEDGVAFVFEKFVL